MSKENPSDARKKDLDIMLSKLNALEVSAGDNYQKSIIKILRTLVEGQMHTLNELDHFKKAIDLVTMQLFKVDNKVNSSLKNSVT